jgi:hypothetical protein
MAEAGPGVAGGYVAFISYSHKDAAIGRWLHRKLEGYRLPRRLAGTEGEDGEVPARLTPIFRDRDELPAAGDLSRKVRSALAASRNLVVVCSPHSATSPWVSKEIATFRELHPDRPIFTAIVEGEPGECFAPALREGGIEPLAADLRKAGDGARLGLLKLVAGLAGVGLDSLVQRDAQRRVRRVTYVTVAAVAAMLAMALLTAFAVNARAEAQRQRTQAEGLVEFMLTDLRDKLKGVGRLDVLTAVNRRALDYYRRQDLRKLPAESLERRSRTLHLLGADDLDRFEYDRALAEFGEAARSTEALLAKAPDDPNRIYGHAQSEFWIGMVDYNHRRYDKATASFQRYKILADRLVAIDPRNPDWLAEAAYAEGNLCTTALKPPLRPKAALNSCARSLAQMKRAYEASRNPSRIDDIANRLAWLADAYRATGNPQRSWILRQEQEWLLNLRIAADPRNMDLKDMWLTSQPALASLEVERGEPAKARRRLLRALSLADSMVLQDPENKQWASHRERVREEVALIN